jgi:hypothetical protein
VHELVVILSDFFSPPTYARSASAHGAGDESRAARASADAAALPRLTALETVLARARREPLMQDWRVWLARREAAPELAPAALVARAWGLASNPVAPASPHAPAAGSCWLATPVHLVAGIDRVLLHPAGLLQLPSGEQQQLVEQFAQVFADSPWRLSCGGQRELLLAGPSLAVPGSDPARFLGADPAAGLPQGREAVALRRLGSELELWLHEHPLNRERLRRGELPVTTLWLWGGAAEVAGVPAAHAPPPQPQPRLPPHGYGSDTAVAALMRVLGGESLPLPAQLDSVLQDTQRRGAAVVLYPLHAQGSDGEGLAPAERLERLAHLERHWLGPALSALRAASIGTLVLVAADRVYHLGRLERWRVWRARAPWWEVLW